MLSQTVFARLSFCLPNLISTKSSNYRGAWKVDRDCFGEAKGNERNTKQKMTGVLSDVVSKINFEVGRLATKGRWERKKGPEEIRGSQVWLGAAISCHWRSARDKRIKWAAHTNTVGRHWCQEEGNSKRCWWRWSKNREELGQLNWADCSYILIDSLSSMRNTEILKHDQLLRVRKVSGLCTEC